MASGIFSVFDDIAALMDDVAIASKIASRKTAGILGDDLAVNAEKATGFLASRELPVLWAITKGSFINKLIIIPVTLLLMWISPIAIKVILILGGFYLAYEGVEKIIEFLFHRHENRNDIAKQALHDNAEAEKAKIKSATTTDFILSVEIVVIALGTVMDEVLLVQVITVIIVSLLATVGVYGLVALIVRMDDLGYKMIKKSNEQGWRAILGKGLVKSLPIVIKFFALVGTLALLLVSGGIFVHNIPFIHDLFPQWPSMLKEFLVGFVVGLIAVEIVKGVKAIFKP